ncbi:MAG: NACHT domain-containing protein [Chloroflexota bacterium]
MVSKKDNKQNDPLDDNVIVTGGGNVVGGTNTIDVRGEVITINMPGYTEPADVEKLRSEYLEYVMFAYGKLELNGIPVSGGLLPRVSLESIYVQPYVRREFPSRASVTKAYPWGENFKNDLSFEEAIKQENRIIILGNPGSGKTTILKWLAIQLASKPIGPLPIIVSLNAYSAALEKGERNLQQFLSDYYAGAAKGVANLSPLFDDALSQGNAIILLDGLDEVQPKNRPYLVSKIEAFAREATAQNNRVIVTSRIAGYEVSPLDMQDWSLFTLIDFDQSSTMQFLTKLFTAFSKAANSMPDHLQSAQILVQKFITTINQNQTLSGLAGNPFFLTVLASLSWQKGSLPSNRAELYELYLRILINTWNTTRSLDNRLVGQSLDYIQTVSILGKLTLWLKEENLSSSLIPEERLLDWLTNYYAGEEWNKPRGEARKYASEYLDSIRQYSNILVDQGKGYVGFLHLSIEEHLAGRGIVQVETKQRLSIIKKHIDEPEWNDSILAAISIMNIQGYKREAKEILNSLLSMGESGILLAKKSLNDLGEENLGKETAEKIRKA